MERSKPRHSRLSNNMIEKDSMNTHIKEQTLFLNQQPGQLQVILVAIAHTGIRETLVQAIADDTPYFVHTVSTSLEALEATRDCIPDLLILDYYLSPCSGIALSDQLHAYKEIRHVPTIVLSDRHPHEVREINRRGLLSLGRPYELIDLLALVNRALHAPTPT